MESRYGGGDRNMMFIYSKTRIIMNTIVRFILKFSIVLQILIIYIYHMVYNVLNFDRHLRN